MLLDLGFGIWGPSGLQSGAKGRAPPSSLPLSGSPGAQLRSSRDSDEDQGCIPTPRAGAGQALPSSAAPRDPRGLGGLQTLLLSWAQQRRQGRGLGQKQIRTLR